MNRQEFEVWLDYHTVRFSGVLEWLRKQNDPRATKDAWANVMGGLTLTEAKAASDQLFAADRDPPYPDGHPRTIIGLAKGSRRDKGGSRFREGKMIDGVYAYACLYCHDSPSGLVQVWTPKALECYQSDPSSFILFADGHQTKDGWCYHSVSIRCCCERGEMGRAHIAQRFDPAVHKRKPPGDEAVLLSSLLAQPEAALPLFT